MVCVRWATKIVGQRVIVGGAEEKVRPVVVADGRAAGVRVAAAVAERTVERVVVVHSHPDVLVLVAELQRVLSLHPGEVDLRIEQGGILPLWVGALAPERAEAGDAGRGQTAGNDRIAWRSGKTRLAGW